MSESKESHLRVLTEIIVFVALSSVLYFIRFYVLPLGGSITAGSMVPIFWVSFRRGSRAGIEAGFLLGLIVMTIEPFLFHPVQVILDYLIPFAALGLAGLFKKQPLIGVALGMTLRFISHFLSGIIFADIFIFPYYPEANPIVFSALYNGSYIVPELIISMVIIYILTKTLKNYL